MDGVLVHEGRMIPGADAFVTRLREAGRPFLILTTGDDGHPADQGRGPLPSIADLVPEI